MAKNKSIKTAERNGVHAPQKGSVVQLQSFDPFASSYNSASRYGPPPVSTAPAAMSAAGMPGSGAPQGPVGPMAAAAIATAATGAVAASRRGEQEKQIEVSSPAPQPRNEATAQWLGLTSARTTQQAYPIHKQTASQSDSLISKSSTRLSSYDIDFASIELEKEIGKGSFGKIFKASWNETPVAVKFLVNYEPKNRFQVDDIEGDDFKLKQTEKLLHTLEAEAEMLSVLRHPNIVQYLGVCMDPSSMCIVTEYCGNGSLADVIRKKTLTWDMAARMLLDAATGMLYLHSRNILHCDLKSNNILVDSHYRTKICDFNMSKLIEESTGSSLANIQNPRWLAPEICEGSDSHSKASDVYSFGIVMWEVLSGEIPWKDSKPWEIVQLIKEGGRPTTPNFWDCVDARGNEFTAFDEFVKLLTDCWDQNPYSRPSFNDIIRELKEIVLFTSSGRDSSGPGHGYGGNESAIAPDTDEYDAATGGTADPRLFSNASTKVFFSNLRSN